MSKILVFIIIIPVAFSVVLFLSSKIFVILKIIR